jgi:hypothetical protein
MAISEEEYEQHRENIQHRDPADNVGYSSDSQMLSDEMKYTEDIIKDDLWKLVMEDYLNELCLKQRTVDKLKNFIRVSTSFETVVNKYSDRDVYREKLGLQLNSIYLALSISGLEKSYNDIDATLINNEIHHRTKVLRGRDGFERLVQKTNVVKTTAKSILGVPEVEKTGIARYAQGRRN